MCKVPLNVFEKKTDASLYLQAKEMWNLGFSVVRAENPKRSLFKEGRMLVCECFACTFPHLCRYFQKNLGRVFVAQFIDPSLETTLQSYLDMQF